MFCLAQDRLLHDLSLLEVDGGAQERVAEDVGCDREEVGRAEGRNEAVEEASTHPLGGRLIRVCIER